MHYNKYFNCPEMFALNLHGERDRKVYYKTTTKRGKR